MVVENWSLPNSTPFYDIYEHLMICGVWCCYWFSQISPLFLLISTESRAGGWKRGVEERKDMDIPQISELKFLWRHLPFLCVQNVTFYVILVFVPHETFKNPNSGVQNSYGFSLSTRTHGKLTFNERSGKIPCHPIGLPLWSVCPIGSVRKIFSDILQVLYEYIR